MVLAVFFFLDSLNIYKDWKSNDINLKNLDNLCKSNEFLTIVDRLWYFLVNTLYIANVIYSFIIYKFMRTDDNLQGISKLDHQLKVSLF